MNIHRRIIVFNMGEEFLNAFSSLISKQSFTPSYTHTDNIQPKSAQLKYPRGHNGFYGTEYVLEITADI